MVTTVQKKSRARARHKEAIAGYQAWLKDNPRATKKKKVEMFNLFVDSAYLNERVNGSD